MKQCIRAVREGLTSTMLDSAKVDETFFGGKRKEKREQSKGCGPVGKTVVIGGGGPDSETSRIVTCVDCCETRYVLEFHKLSVKYDRLFLGATSCPNFDFPAELFPYFVFRNSFRVQNYSFTVTIFMTCGASLDSY